MEFEHASVLLEEVIENLNIRPKGVYLDGTLGGGGHSLEICRRLDENGVLIGVDQDREAIAAAEKRLAEAANKKIFVNDNFNNVKNFLKPLDVDGLDGVVLDLGVSSYQLDNPERGFSYMQDAPLDMRMSSEGGLTAEDIVNEYAEGELHRIIKDYGEERWAKRIAEFIVAARSEKRIETTLELVEIIKHAVPLGARKDGPHPAKRTFQAIRIEVNGELEILEKSIKDMVELLNKKGRICIITFHSLEDRIVKNVFNELSTGCTCPKDFPVCVCNNKPVVKKITKKPIISSEFELENNPRCRSAKLRVAQKL